MRIGLFTDSYKPYICGVTTSVDMLRSGLEALGHEVYIITTKLTPEQKKNYTEDEKNVIRISGIHLHGNTFKNFRISLFSNIKYYQKLRKYNFDIIHIHTEFTMGILGITYAKHKKIPIVYTAHTLWEQYFHFLSKFLAKHARKQLLWILKKLMNSYAKKAEFTITPTNKTKDILENYNLDTEYAVIPTGIDISRFFKTNVDLKRALEIRRSYNIKDTDYCFIYLGRISEEKSIDVLLEQFLKLEEENTKFMIVGEGAASTQLKEIVAKSDKKDKVIFTGSVPWEEVPLYYQAADCFLNASKTETQGLTYVEALASGLPAILRNDSVLDELIVDGENGLLFDNNEELLNHMKELINNSELNLKISEKAVKSVEKYSKECYTNNVLELYKKALENKKSE